MTERRFIDGKAGKGKDKPSTERVVSKRRTATDDKRERILRAAVKVFAKKGFYASRVSEIAKAAGVADGTIYLYFESKDDVLESLFEERSERLLEVLRGELAKNVDPPAKLQRMIEIQLGLIDGHRDLAEVITVNLRQSTRLLRQYGSKRFVEYLELLASVVHEGQETGHFRLDVSPRVMARVLFGALDGLVLTWALGDGRVGGLEKTAAQLVSVLVRGLERRAEDGGIEPGIQRS
ncbi:MAG: TetR/AcrR family transcriptional regulator [Deltaproteobacteria bacterium]|nr:TetR/AcrR family transcriptional regulator [Deltaproteobacteria bacterium]